jgi:hypothetical protein
LQSAPLPSLSPTSFLDARYEKVREGGVVMSQAVLIASTRRTNAGPASCASSPTPTPACVSSEP